MNVKVKIELSLPAENDKEEMYNIAKALTNNLASVYIYNLDSEKYTMVAEFTVNESRQSNAVDKIAKAFRRHMMNYSQSSISFPNALTKRRIRNVSKKYTHMQGQYLSFIYYFTKLNGIAPSEVDIQKYFRKSSPTIHNMILKLEENGFIERVQNTPRSIRILLSRSELPDLE